MFALWRRYGWLIVLAVYLLLCLFHVQRQDADKDELTSVQITRHDLPWIVRNRLQAGHAPGFFLILKAASTVTGPNYGALLKVSFALGWLTLWLVTRVLRRLGLSREMAWLAALLFALHPSFLFFARYLRPWIGVMALTLLITLVWLGLVDMARTRWHRVRSVLWLTLPFLSACWNHSLIAIWLLLFLPTVRRKASPKLYAGFFLALLAHVVIFIACRNMRDVVGPIAWIEPLVPLTAIELVVDLFGGKAAHITTFDTTWVFTILTASMFILGLHQIYFKRTATDRTLLRIIAIPGWLGILFIIASGFSHHSLAVYRYVAAGIPAFLIIVLCGLRTLPRRQLLIFILFFAASGLVNDLIMIEMRRVGLRNSLQKLARKIDLASAPGILVFTESAREAALEFGPPNTPTILTYRKLSLEMGWRTLSEQGAGLRTLWVVYFWHQGGIVEDPQWPKIMGPPLAIISNRACTIRQFAMPKNMPQFTSATLSSDSKLTPEMQD